ncbi:hypothetical protein V8V69_14630, partial [Niallia circulans]
LFDDTDLEERERSRYNKQQLESIRNDMESVQSKLKNKMEELWDLYESKVKKYENTDDEYANKASRVKDRYTTFSERVSDVISVTAEGAWDFVKGLAVAIYEIAKGLITLVIDAGIVAASGIIPDSIEPDFLKKASTKRIESATETLDAIIHDPVIVLESMAQSITDTAEKEGIMYVSGSAATSFLPYVGQAKYLKLLKGEKSKNKANGIRSAISRKTTESLQRIDRSKKENSLWPNGIKNSGKQYVQEVTHFFRQTFMPHPSFQLSTANQAPINVWSRATIENRMDSIDPASLRKVEGKETTKGIDNANHPIRTYRNADLKKLEEKYTADSRITVEMPYVGKGKAGTNSEGWLRDKDFYWKEIMNKHPESLSKANKQKIQLGFSPINDKTFREHFPQYDIKELYNDKLIHHHVGGGGQAVAVPCKLHPGTGGIHNAEKAAGVWGNDSEYAELLEKFLNK